MRVSALSAKRKKRSNFFYIIAIVSIIVFGLILDQFSKFLILKKLILNESVPIIKNIFHLTLIFNRGAAFGIFKNYTNFFIFTSILTIFFIIFHLRRNKVIDRLTFSMILILTGALGNLIDRLRFGFVIDFLDFRIWPVFNLADTMITIGALLLAFSILRSSGDASCNF
ncbi:MAG: signal peptidase II [Candidatus Omnitrophica bacterium]|nr:signal peptidase II [Candidatus Omnitrophota bacterium]